VKLITAHRVALVYGHTLFISIFGLAPRTPAGPNRSASPVFWFT